MYHVEVLVYYRRNKTVAMRTRMDCDTLLEAIERAAREVEFQNGAGFHCAVKIWQW